MLFNERAQQPALTEQERILYIVLVESSKWKLYDTVPDIGWKMGVQKGCFKCFS